MLSFIFRVFIVFTVFIAGAFVGNIYMPQKTLQQSHITALDEPETSLNEQNTPGLEAALSSLNQIELALQNSDMGKEAVFNLTDSIERQLYLQAFQTAKSSYEIQLLKIQKQPLNHDAFLKARNNYYDISSKITLAFPPNPQEDIIILDTPATQQLNLKISTSTAQTEKQTLPETEVKEPKDLKDNKSVEKQK